MSALPQLDKNYLTMDGDVLDKICWLFYGQSSKTTEAVLKRNPLLNRYPSVLPAGLILVLPVMRYEAQRKPLWDYVQPKRIDLTRVKSDATTQDDALAQYRLAKTDTIYVAERVTKLYSPNSTVLPVLVGSQVPTEFTTPPRPDIPQEGGQEYVAVYYRGADNQFKVGFVPNNEVAVDEILISGEP
jgi:phage tail protein X